MPEIAAAECNACKECFPLCPTSYLQAAFVLVEALAFPQARAPDGARAPGGAPAPAEPGA